MRRERAALQTECCICCRGRLTVSPLLVVRKVAWVGGRGEARTRGQSAGEPPAFAFPRLELRSCGVNTFASWPNSPSRHGLPLTTSPRESRRRGAGPIYAVRAAARPPPRPAPPGVRAQRGSAEAERATRRVRAVSRVPARVRSSAVIRCTRVTLLTIIMNICAHYHYMVPAATGPRAVCV